MSKLAFTPTTPQAHSCVCDPNQMNALASTNQCTENVRLLPMPTSIIHATPPLTHSRVSLVSLPRASTLPENLLLYRYLNVRCAQHGQACVHANNTPVIFLCLRSEPNECTRFNYPTNAQRTFRYTFYAYDRYTRKPSSDSQNCQTGELAEGLDISR